MKTNYFKLNQLAIAVLFVLSMSFSTKSQSTDNALYFDGNDDYVLVDNPNDFDVGANTDFTFQALIKTTAGYNESIFSKMTPSAPQGFQIWIYNNKLLFEWAHNGIAAQIIQSTGNINNDQCHHIAVVVDRSETKVSLYIDGSLDSEHINARYAQDIQNTAPVYIGQERELGALYRYSGELDEIAFFNSIRTSQEIQQSSQFQLNGDEAGLVAYWQFNSGTASGNNAGVTTAIDSQGSNNSGTLQNFSLSGSTSNWVTSSCALPEPPPPTPSVPLNNWAILIGVILILTFKVIGLRKIF